MPQLPTVPEGVLSPQAKRTYDLAKWFAGLTASLLGAVAAILWALSTLGLVSFGAEAKSEKAAPAPAEWQAMQAALSGLKAQGEATAAKMDRIEQRVEQMALDVAVTKSQVADLRGRR